MTSEFFDAGLPIEIAGFRAMPEQVMLEVDEAATLQSSLQAAGLLQQAGIGADVLEQDWADLPGGELAAKTTDSGGLPDIATDFQEHDNLPDGTWIFQSLDAVYQSGALVGFFGYESLGCVMGPNGIPIADTWIDFVFNVLAAAPVGVVHIGNGNTLVRWDTGALSLYVNGQYLMDVRINNVTITDGSPTYDIELNRSGGRFSYSANDGNTYHLVPAE